MSITNGYGTLAKFLARYEPGATAGEDTARDTHIEETLQAVSRAIDGYCGRSFYSSPAHTARAFSAVDYDTVFIDDLATLDADGVKTDDNGDGTYETTWPAGDFVTMPENAATITWLEVSLTGGRTFPTWRKGVQITGTWGYALPDPVAEACYLQAYRLYLRKTAPFGIAGSAEMGQVMVLPTLDPDVELLLTAYVRQV